MKRGVVFLLLFLVTSCDYFNVKKTTSEAILNEELKTFNWNEVDEYPSFEVCNASSTRQARKQCFEQTLSQEILNHLKSLEITVAQDINDTLIIDFKVSETGKLSLLNIEADSLTVSEIPDIKTYLKKSVDSLPEIAPAIKRGQPVKTQFKLPVVIVVN